MKVIRIGGLVGFFLGCILLVVAIVNLGKAADKPLMLSVVGSAVFLAGVILVGLGNVLRSIDSLRQPSAGSGSARGTGGQ
jgi:hypothetical protein